jgi:hypothetical protein
MGQYAKGISYRTVHEGACFAIDRFETGASHMDAPTASDTPDSTLTAAYDSLDGVVRSFSFAQP